MAGARERLIEEIRGQILAGRYRPDVERMAAAALADFSRPAPLEEFQALILLESRVERVLVQLALAERGVSAACLDGRAALDELVAHRPGLLVVDPFYARRSADELEQALPDARLLLLGDAASTRLTLPRPLRLAALESVLPMAVPSRLARRALNRVLLVEGYGALAEELRSAGRQVFCARNAEELAAEPPPGPFDVAFPGPALAADPAVRAALAMRFGPEMIICAA